MLITNEERIQEYLKTDWDVQQDGTTVFVNSGKHVMTMCLNVIYPDTRIYQIDTYSLKDECQGDLYDIHSFSDADIGQRYKRDDIEYHCTEQSAFNALMVKTQDLSVFDE